MYTSSRAGDAGYLSNDPIVWRELVDGHKVAVYGECTWVTALKSELMVGRQPNNLRNIKAVVITLDEEWMAAYDPDRHDSKPRPMTCTSQSEATTPQSMLEIKAETERILVPINPMRIQQRNF